MGRARLALLLLVTTLGSACALGASGPRFTESRPASLPSDRALLVIFRSYAEPILFGANVSLDGKELCSLGQKSFTWVLASPGRHLITNKWSAMAGPPEVSLLVDLVAGGSYFVQVGAKVRLGSASGSATGTESVWKTESGLLLLRPGAGDAVVESCCRYEKPAVSAF